MRSSSEGPLWKTQQVRIEGDAPVELIRERLRQDVAQSVWLMRSPDSGWLGGSRIVRGVVTADRVRLSAGYPNVRNSWRRVLFAELRTDAPGLCVLQGTLRWYRSVEIFMVVWCSLLVLFTVAGLASVVVHVAAGDVSWNSLEPAGFLAVFWIVTSLIFGSAGHMARADERFLLDWLQRELASSRPY